MNQSTCPNPPVIVPLQQYYPTGECDDICSLGMNTNRGYLDYTFGSMLNTSFCGSKLGAEPSLCSCASRDQQAFPGYDCKACPCKTANQSCSMTPEQLAASQCDYGFARDHYAFQNPNGGNRYGSIRWG